MALTKITSDLVESNIQQTGFKNKIIGGDFSTNPWQRGTTFNSVANNTYTADRWQYNKSSSSVVSIFKTSDSPTVNQAGAYTQHCLHVDVLTAEVINSSSYAVIEQKIEGLNIMPLGFGQPGSRFITLSFWHKHTKTGIYSISLSNSAQNRSYVAEYTQNTTDTWEKSLITIPIDTVGVWLQDNNIGLRVRFCIASGSAFHTSAGGWVSGTQYSSPNQVNALDSTSNNFKIALVQLEFGSTDSLFDSRSVGQELSLCQRYYNTGTFREFSSNAVGYSWSVNTRATGTLSTSGGTINILGTNGFWFASGTLSDRTVSVSAEL